MADRLVGALNRTYSDASIASCPSGRWCGIASRWLHGCGSIANRSAPVNLFSDTRGPKSADLPRVIAIASCLVPVMGDGFAW